jgi:hypothetical protein
MLNVGSEKVRAIGWGRWRVSVGGGDGGDGGGGGDGEGGGGVGWREVSMWR